MIQITIIYIYIYISNRIFSYIYIYIAKNQSNRQKKIEFLVYYLPLLSKRASVKNKT